MSKILNETGSAIYEGLLGLFLLYYLVWFFTNFYGGMQIIWYLANRRNLKSVPYKWWFRGYPITYFFVVISSFFFWFSAWYVACVWDGYYHINNWLRVEASDVYLTIFFTICFLGIWYPYAAFKNFAAGRKRKLKGEPIIGGKV